MGLHKHNYCRKGCKAEETEDHIFLRCPFYTKHRHDVMTLCKIKAIPFTLSNLFTRQTLQIHIERWIEDILA